MNIVILAAGQGKRMKSALPKVLQTLAGKPLLQHVLTTALFYLANIATLYFSFVVFGAWPDPFVIIFGYTVAIILSVFSLMPETPGIMEASLILIFGNLGFPLHIALFASLLYRVFAYWLPLPLGIASYFRLKKACE